MKQKTLLMLMIFVYLLTSCRSSDTDSIIKETRFLLSEGWSYQLGYRVYRVAILDDWIAIGKSYGIESIDAKTGRAMWTLSFPLETESLLSFSDGNLIASDDSQIRVIDKSGEEVSSINMDSRKDRAQIIAVYSSYVFVVRIPSYVLEVYNIKTESIIWEKLVDRGGVTINFDLDTNTVFVTTSRFVAAHDVLDGSPKWEIDQIARTCVLDQGVLYYYAVEPTDADRGYVIAVDSKSSDQLWKVEIPLTERTAVYNLAVLNNALIGSTDSGLIAIDKQDGHSLWQSETNDFFFGKPVVINNVIYIRGTTSGQIYAISPENGHSIGYLTLGEPSLLSLAQDEYDIVYVTENALIFPYANTIYSYSLK